jgi:hypothetical protein
MNSLPPLSKVVRSALILIIAIFYCGIVAHFAWAPDLFSKYDLYFTVCLGVFVVRPLARDILGLPNGHVSSAITSILNLLLEKKTGFRGSAAKVVRVPENLRWVPDEVPLNGSLSDPGSPSNEPVA